MAAALTEADRLHASVGRRGDRAGLLEAAHRRGRARDRPSRLRRDRQRHAVVLVPRACSTTPAVRASTAIWHEAWDGYCQFNEAFADTIAEEAATGATVVVNDYHLALVGRYLAKRRPDLATAFFSHTPFCPPEDLAMLPDRAAPRADGVDVVLRCLRVPHGEVAGRLRTLRGGGRRRARPRPSWPRSARTRRRLDEVAASEACRSRLGRLEDELDGRTLVLRSDRVELSKNLIRGFLAFDELLESVAANGGAASSSWRGVYASRESLPEYLAYRTEIEHVVEQGERALGHAGLHAGRPRPRGRLRGDGRRAASLRAPRRQPHPGRAQPRRHGRARPSTRRDGVLVLSREAGAYDELGGRGGRA